MKLFKTDLKELTDEALMVRLIKKNDHQALTELYGRYSKRLMGYFINMFKGNVALAEDFLQDLFIKILDKKQLFDTNKRFYSWMFTIASNMCKTHFRKQKTSLFDEEQVEYEQPTLSMNLSNEFDKRVFRLLLRENIDLLNFEHKVVFILRYHQGFSLKEIGEITETNLGTVKSRLFYATKKMAKALKEFAPEGNEELFNIS